MLMRWKKQFSSAPKHEIILIDKEKGKVMLAYKAEAEKCFHLNGIASLLDIKTTTRFNKSIHMNPLSSELFYFALRWKIQIFAVSYDSYHFPIDLLLNRINRFSTNFATGANQSFYLKFGAYFRNDLHENGFDEWKRQNFTILLCDYSMTMLTWPEFLVIAEIIMEK
ncbi:15334_t:CDS:2 [Rhizophagus irregularis]|nr:15334_t:CDS:2 [Rhizophagus irregularis]